DAAAAVRRSRDGTPRTAGKPAAAACSGCVRPRRGMRTHVASEALEQPDQVLVRYRLGVAPALATHVACCNHGIDDGLFGRLHGGFEHAIKIIVADKTGLAEAASLEWMGIRG